MSARRREPDDWVKDRAAARPTEQRVAAAFKRHHLVRRFHDLSEEQELDFEFEFERDLVRVELKEKLSSLSAEYLSAWPDVPPPELFILDELTLRKLLWSEGMGYLLVHDQPSRRWHTFGPWELSLGPRRRFERPGDRGAGEFLKGKLLIDLRAAAATTTDLDVESVLEVVRRSRAALLQVQAFNIPSEGDLPIIPTRVRPPRPARTATPGSGEQATAEGNASATSDDAFPDRESGWAGLSTGLVRELERRWGWQSLTTVQRAAIPSVLAGHNVLILAPTAGGKTEAALLPLLDTWRESGWAASTPSILAVSPLRALLDDQLVRWRGAAALVGATAFAWHGDIGAEERRAFKDNPADALLTTPESLENLLTSGAHDERRLFAGLRAVVIDEVHAFVGTSRGAQLASLLERLNEFTRDDFQRVGLSATVANPGDVLAWLKGGSLREYRVISGGSPVQGEDIAIRTYGDTAEAVALLGEVTHDARSIIFTRSRRRAEELAQGLAIPVHHSSVAAGHRSAALDDLASGRVRCVVATASLEMGIDVADLDLVAHDGAPTSPSSYLQRLGRAGRRTGHRRLVFTLESADDLLLTLAVLARVRRGNLDPTPTRQGARLVLGQQALAHVMQTFISDRHRLTEMLRWSPVFSGLEHDADATVGHLLTNGWLYQEQDRLVIGREGQRRFGGPRGISQLLATFSVADAARIETEDGQPIGSIDWEQVEKKDQPHQEKGLVLGGRAWMILRVDRQAGLVVVRPSDRGRARSWRGPSLEVSRSTWEAVREVLAGTDVPTVMDERAKAWLQHQRVSWARALEAPVETDGQRTSIHSFGGVTVHRAALAGLGFEGHAGGPTLAIEAAADVVRARAAERLGQLEQVVDDEARRQMSVLQVRHRDLLPETVLHAEAREFHVDADGIRRCLEIAAGGPWRF